MVDFGWRSPLKRQSSAQNSDGVVDHRSAHQLFGERVSKMQRYLN
jgi:hypothetical protein